MPIQKTVEPIGFCQNTTAIKFVSLIIVEGKFSQHRLMLILLICYAGFIIIISILRYECGNKNERRPPAQSSSIGMLPGLLQKKNDLKMGPLIRSTTLPLDSHIYRIEGNSMVIIV